MRLGCAFRESGKINNGKKEAPEICKGYHCNGLFKIRKRQEEQFKKTFPCFLPDIETIMKVKTVENMPKGEKPCRDTA